MARNADTQNNGSNVRDCYEKDSTNSNGQNATKNKSSNKTSNRASNTSGEDTTGSENCR